MQEQRSGYPSSRWLVRSVLALVLVAVVAVVVYAVTRPVQPRPAPALQARLELAAGEVTIDVGDGPVRAVSGTALVANAHISTAKGARALVRLPDGSTVFLRDNSAVELGVDAVELETGEYWLDAPPVERKAMVHRSGDVTVSAADAGLSIQRDGERVVVYVARGMATVSGKGGRVEVNSGEQCTVAAAAAPRVAPVAFWADWTGGMADFKSTVGLAGAGRGLIYGVDGGAAPGSPARRLEISRQVVRAVLRDDGLSETEVDQTFFNPGERLVEGWYWFTVPEGASVTGFAVETDGTLVEGESIEHKEAAAKYTVAKSTGHAPAILEWVDSHSFRARIYPVPAGGTRRVVLRYIELRALVDGKLDYVYPMASSSPVRIGEFSLTVELGDAGTKMKIATLADARIEADGKRVTMRRSGYTPRADFQLEARLAQQRPAVDVARYEAGGDSADYVMVRYTPEVDWNAVRQQRGDVVVVVDSSAAGDESARQLKTATAEAILRALSDDDRFALVALDERASVLHPPKDLAPASDQEISRALEALAEHAVGGATDLAAMFDVSLRRLHGAEQPAVVYVGDGAAPWPRRVRGCSRSAWARMPTTRC
jgi:Ca-activated chloride channel family protein